MSSIDFNDSRKKELNAVAKCCLNFDRFRKFDIVLQQKLISSIEKSIYESSIDKARERNIPIGGNSEPFIELYSNIGYQVKINLDVNSRINNDKNDIVRYYLINKLCDYIIVSYLIDEYKKPCLLSIFPKEIFHAIINWISTINVNEIGYMNSLQLNPYINQSFIDELLLREKQKIKIKYSTMYTCAQCGNKKTQQKEIQTRSGDEGGTLFIYCLVCNHTWRIY